MRFQADAPFMIEHVELLCSSYRRWTGKELLPPELSPIDAQGAQYDAPFALLSHDAEPDPVFNYGNRRAQQFFEATWDELIGMPSRRTAEEIRREDRQYALDQVAAHGYVDGYTGMRISKNGRRFLIRDTTIWNIVDGQGGLRGQAALMRAWADAAHVRLLAAVGGLAFQLFHQRARRGHGVRGGNVDRAGWKLHVDADRVHFVDEIALFVGHPERQAEAGVFGVGEVLGGGAGVALRIVLPGGLTLGVGAHGGDEAADVGQGQRLCRHIMIAAHRLARAQYVMFGGVAGNDRTCALFLEAGNGGAIARRRLVRRVAQVDRALAHPVYREGLVIFEIEQQVFGRRVLAVFHARPFTLDHDAVAAAGLVFSVDQGAGGERRDGAEQQDEQTTAW